MAPDFRKAFRGFGGGDRAEGQQAGPAAAAVGPAALGPASLGPAAAVMPAVLPPRPPEVIASPPPTFESPAARAREADAGSPGPGAAASATTAPAAAGSANAPAQPYSATLSKSLGLPEGKSDNLLDIRAQAAAILGDVIGELVRESRLESPEVVDEKRQEREQDFARLLEDARESRPASLAHHAFDPTNAWGYGSEDVERSMHRPRNRERRGRGRLF